ncbi:MAG: Cof-type HAD-IIB family hydrolase [Eubacteriales bacterium]
MNKKALFFDIDGTLITHGVPIEKSTIEALKQVKENGHSIFICTGRSRSMVLDEFIDSVGFDGVIAACGTYCEYQKEILFNTELTRNETDFIMDILQKYDVTYIFEGKEYLYYNNVEMENTNQQYIIEMVKSEIKERLLKVEEVNGNIVANKFSCYINSGEEEVVYEEFSKLYSTMRHRKNAAEFVPVGYHKATGIQKMCEYLKILQEDTFAFGDSVNDIEMLDYCQVGVVMGNGTAIAKEHADYITTDIDKDGIYQACKHFKLF